MTDCRNYNHMASFNLGRFLGMTEPMDGVSKPRFKDFQKLGDEIGQAMADHHAHLGCDTEGLPINKLGGALKDGKELAETAPPAAGRQGAGLPLGGGAAQPPRGTPNPRPSALGGIEVDATRYNAMKGILLASLPRKAPGLTQEAT
jgi:hypothetical protein